MHSTVSRYEVCFGRFVVILTVNTNLPLTSECMATRVVDDTVLALGVL